MTIRSPRLAFALLLGFVLVLATGLSAAHAGEMAAGVTVSAGMGMDGAGHDGCDGCGTTDGAAFAGCQWTCVALAVLPSAPPMANAEPAAAPVGRDFRPDGRAAPPDPHPPRSDGLA